LQGLAIEGRVSETVLGVSLPVSGVIVTILSGDTEISTLETSLLGTYSVDVNPGIYSVKFEKAGYASDQTNDVTVGSGETKTVNKMLSRLTGSLSGTISKGSNPITIKVMDGENEVASVKQVTTFSLGGGVYSISNIPLGTYSVVATKTGATKTFENVVINEGTNLLNIGF
jgi:hypothetical protein